MQVFNVSRNLFAGLAFTILSLGAANAAGFISTPIIFQGDGNQLVCIANNVHTAPITVVVRIVGLTTTVSQTCTLPVGDRDGCEAFKNNDAGHCVISMAGATNADVFARVRGVMFSRKTLSPFSTDAVVEAR
jgi:hypothetical protein